jgi:cell wall-associated NlpC family hydrolase
MAAPARRLSRRVLLLLSTSCLVLRAIYAGAQALAVVPSPVVVPPAGGAFPAPSTIVQAARSFLGVPYVHGGDSRAGLDCSGLVYRVYHDILGIELPRGVGALYRAGQPAGPRLHVGDLLFFDTDDAGGRSTPTHVGVYSGGGRFLHAASEGAKTGVTVSSLDSPYYSDRFLGARRVFPWRAPVLALTVTDDPTSVSDPRPFPSKEPLVIDV